MAGGSFQLVALNSHEPGTQMPLQGPSTASVAGSYSALPTNLTAEPVTGAGLTGATLSLGMTAVWTANAVTTTNASATGTAGRD
jgi:hypothetical protein